MNTKRMIRMMIAMLCGSAAISAPAEARQVSSQPAVQGIPGSAWTIEEARYTGEVGGDVARLTAQLTLKVFRDGWQEVPLVFGNATITDLKVTGGSATLGVRNDQYTLTVMKRGTYHVTATLAAHLTRDAQYEGIAMEIPQAVFSKLNLTIPRAQVELAPEHALTVTRKTQGGLTILSASLGLSRQLALRWMARPVKAAAVEPAYSSEIKVLATLEEEGIRMIALVGIHILQGELKSIAMDVPASLTVSTVRGLPIEDWKVTTVDGQTKRVTITLSEPLQVGAAQVIVEGEQPLPQPGGQIVLPRVVPMGTKRLTGTLAIATGTSMELKDPVLEGFSRIDVREVPQDLMSWSTVPVVSAFRYLQPPYRITASLHRPEELAVLVAIAESADLSTIVTPTGEIITRAIYQVRNNKKSSLGMTLPKGAILWSVLVDRTAVKPAAGPDGQILVPLAASHGPESTFPVEVVYVEKSVPFEWTGKAAYQGPTLDIPITIAHWMLFLPDEIQGYWFAGNLERRLQVAGFLPDPQPFTQVAQVEGDKLASRKFHGPYDRLDLDAKRVEAAEKARRVAAQHHEEIARSATAASEVPAALLYQSEYEGKPSADRMMNNFRTELAEVQQSGVLPFRIAIPQSGRVHRFGRLLTTGEPLVIRLNYFKRPSLPLVGSGVGLIGLLGLGGGLRASLRCRRPRPTKEIQLP